MLMVDPHVHIESCKHEDLALMALAGIRIVITQTYYPHLHVPITSQTLFDLYERAIEFETRRASEHLIDVYIAVGINPLVIPPDYDRVLEAIPKYLGRERVVAIGEIGLDPRSETLPDLAKQEEIVRAQLKIAKEYDKPVVFHTPPDKEKWVKHYIRLVTEEKLSPDRVIIDHADASVVKLISDSGFYAGITVQPWRKIGPRDAAEIMQTCDLDRIIIDSDCSLVLPSDILSVAKTAFEMQKLGFSQDDINKVTFENPARAFNLPSG